MIRASKRPEYDCELSRSGLIQIVQTRFVNTCYAWTSLLSDTEILDIRDNAFRCITTFTVALSLHPGIYQF